MIVVGNGQLAQAFKQKTNDSAILIFASGVSNSLETNLETFKREKYLLLETINQHQNYKLLYFSTCSIYDPSLNKSLYIKHKLEMEHIIKNETDKFLIFRASNVVGNMGNPNTLINFLFHNIASDIPFEVWKNSYRNLIHIDDLVHIVNQLLPIYTTNGTINIANTHSYSILQIIEQIEACLHKKALYTFVNKGADYLIDIAEVKSYITNYPQIFELNYLKKIIDVIGYNKVL